MRRDLLVEHDFFRRSILGPILMALRWMGLLPPRFAAWLLVRGLLPYSLLDRWVRVPTDRARTWLAGLLVALPRQLPVKPLSPRTMTCLVFFLDYLPAALANERDRCIQDLGGRDDIVTLPLLSHLPTSGGFSLVGPIIMAGLSAREKDPDRLLKLQSGLFSQLRAQLRQDTHWDKDTRRTLFIGAGLVFAARVAPALYGLLEARGFPSDLPSIRLVVFCRRRLAQVKTQADDKGVSGVDWQANYARFMDWSQAYLNRARLSSPAMPLPPPANRRF